MIVLTCMLTSQHHYEPKPVLNIVHWALTLSTVLTDQPCKQLTARPCSTARKQAAVA